MPSVEFEEESDPIALRFRDNDERPESKMAKWLIIKGIVKTEKQANVILTCVIIIALILSLLLFLYNTSAKHVLYPKLKLTNPDTIKTVIPGR